VAADPILLAELLRNLVSNAVSYAGRGAIVTVRVRALSDGPVLEVEDNGPGLSDAQMLTTAALGRGAPRPSPQIASGPTHGMGLGLAVAFEIARLFQADFRLDRPESGSGLLATIDFRHAAE
jgi:two-component system sensor histidine kinase TctE